MVKYIHAIIGMTIIVVGCAYLSTTIEEAPVRNVLLKVYGVIIVFIGSFYLKKIAKFGKQ
ncbi:hypothetical protein QH639_12450 [Lysinibacillus sp. 1 U-2021]|uniref:hypothetical protein n=1 Tax=unclassified Lysinibacillus TaxID=2636778 RepID=UPI00187D6956|nr:MULTISPECIES: hypothetical protein [unclassified Lysinibacillus]WGT41550.1 hypothetical protein QH639_12450 [Lysinibacillus sp. 1 U-2021]